MADISKCMGRNCERRETCYRYTAPENQYRQSYAFFDEDPKKCEEYWPIGMHPAENQKNKANARLIAAAPELLEALEEAENLARNEPDAQVVPNLYARQEAYGLLSMLPAGVDAPRPVIEPAGDIALEWDQHGAFFVLAVSGIGELEWTSVIDGIESVGSEPLVEALPASVAKQLQAHFTKANA